MEVSAKALRGGVSSSYIKDTFRREAMGFPEGTGAFTVLQRATGTEKTSGAVWEITSESV